MRMVQVKLEDEDGRLFMVLIPEGDEDHPERGVVLGPPYLDDLDLPLDVEVKFNNQLFNRGLITKRDLRGHGAELTAALQAAFRVSANKVAALYEGD